MDRLPRFRRERSNGDIYKALAPGKRGHPVLVKAYRKDSRSLFAKASLIPLLARSQRIGGGGKRFAKKSPPVILSGPRSPNYGGIKPPFSLVFDV